jgi:hypothetical protein
MPLTAKGEKIKEAMMKYYQKKRGFSRKRAESIFYASENKGNIKGVVKGK